MNKKFRSILTVSALIAILPVVTLGTASAQGGLFITGHDPDFHAYQGGNTTGAINIIKDALDYVTDGIPVNNNAYGTVLLITHRYASSPGGHSDPALGMTAAGIAYDMADDGTAG